MASRGESDDRDRSSSPGSPNAGWYGDPGGVHRARWWDGEQWTEQVRDEEFPPDRSRDGQPTARPAEPSSDEDARLLAAAPPPLSATAAPSAGASTGNAAPEDHGSVAVGDGRVRRGVVRLLVASFLLGAMFLAGTAAGWQLFDERVGGRELTDTAEPEVVEVRVPTLLGDASVAVMPDVRGLAEEVALEILADTVLAGEQPIRSEMPWAGPAGIVIEQRPPFGVHNPPGVELTLSVPATVPEAVGRAVGEVVDELEAVGATVEVERRFESGVDADRVLEIEPASGSPVPTVVRIVASEPAGSISLASQDLVEGRCTRTERTVDAIEYGDALACSAGRTSGQWAWLLSRAVDRVAGTVGLPDDGPTDTGVRLVFLADGVPVEEVVLTYGSAVEVSMPTADVLRLELQAVLADGEEADLRTAEFVLADLRMTGSADDLARLRDGS